MSTKSDIFACIEAAKVELQQALAHLEEFPEVDWGIARTAAHTLGNYLNITAACIQLMEMELENHPNPEIGVWLLSLARTVELMAHTTRQMTLSLIHI